MWARVSDTQGNETHIAIYNDEGVVYGVDRFDGSDSLSQLTFGAGTRPAVGNGRTYNGRDGTLAEGTYFLRVGGYQPTKTADVGWDFPSTGSPHAGTIHITIRTNATSPGTCAADFNKDGTLAVQDIFDFLGAWFAGCP